jgi:hypothetical protein
MQAIDIPSPPEQSQPALGEQQLSEGLRFEEYPPRRSKRDHCITYKLTDGRQINTGDGRASRALGYVMEMSPGRWVARVGDLNSGILPLGLAKKATVDLHRRKDKGEPLNWITELNRHMIAEIDRLSVMVSLTDDERYQVKLRWGDFRAEFPRSEYPEDAAHTL